jgi:hypothetical protein
VPCERADDANYLQSSYWYMGLPENVLQPRLVNREFNKNTFEVHDSIATLAKHHKKYVPCPKTVASEWLKRMSKLGLLNSVRKLEINLRFNEEDQTKAQFYRICTAAASMEMLERSVVTLDMTGLWYFPLYEVA